MNERIDIIRWADQPAEYVMSALSPATISSIIVHEDEHKVEVVTLTLTTQDRDRPQRRQQASCLRADRLGN